MNKLAKILIATMAGIDTFMYIFTPFILVLLFLTIFNIDGWRANSFWAVGMLSMLFRAIKIGWMKG